MSATWPAAFVKAVDCEMHCKLGEVKREQKVHFRINEIQQPVL